MPSMVLRWFFDVATIAFNGFRWFRTIGQTMRWFRWIVVVYVGPCYNPVTPCDTPVTPCHTSLHIVPFCYSPVPLSVWSPWLPSSPWSSGHPGCPGYLHHLGHPGHPHHTHYSPHPGRFDLPSLPFSPCSVVTQVTLVQCRGPICQIQVGLLFNRMCMIAISALRGPRLHPLEGLCLTPKRAAT